MAALESILVGLIVAGCALFSAWRLMSVRLRLKTLDALSGLPAIAGGTAVVMLRRRTLAKLSSGCSACQHGGAHPLSANVQPLNQRSGALRR